MNFDSVKQVCVCWGGGWVDFLCASEMKPLREPLHIPSMGKDVLGFNSDNSSPL